MPPIKKPNELHGFIQIFHSPFLLGGGGLFKGLVFADELFDLVQRSAELLDGPTAEVSFLDSEPRLSHRSVSSELVHLQNELKVLPTLLPFVNEE